MVISAPFASTPPPLSADHTDPSWAAAPPLVIDRTWQGATAPAELATTVRVLWTAEHLWLGFVCACIEIDADDTPVDTRCKRHGLWERDVCEAFIWSPGEPSADSYKEFEVAPTGQWYDVAIRRPRADVDATWASGMDTAAAVDADARRWRATMRVPFAALAAVPRRGDRWRANLFRIGRYHGDRQYLALSPTHTPRPDFHVPGRFVPLVFS